MLEGFADEPLPGGDGAEHEAGVDVVEVVIRPAPLLRLHIIDLEVYVVRNPDWLNWAQVRPNDGRRGVLFRHFERPDSRPGADVEDGFGFREGGEVEVAIAE